MSQEQPQPAAPSTREPPTYEEARDELVETVRLLEAGGVSLEESLALWERGERLAAICEERLEGARRRLDAVLEGSPDGDAGGVDLRDQDHGDPS